MVITFLGASTAAWLIIDLDVQLAFLLGAIIVVSGPTVIGPLLAAVRPSEPTVSILKYEGTFLDPIGATLGVVVLNLVLASDRGGVHPAIQGLGRLGLGVLVGLVAAAVLVFVLSRFWVPDDMEAAVALLFAIAAFAISDTMLSEAGLFATLTLGVTLANQPVVSIRRIRGFGDTLEVLIIAILFILLGALVTIEGLRDYFFRILVLVAALVVLVRPLTATIALWRTRLQTRDKALIGWVDPRGIVAASTAATFTGSLAAADIDSEFLLPVVFGVILGTGIVYGLTAKPVAALLGADQPPARGVLLIGDAPWIVDLAGRLRDAAASVLLAVPVAPPEAAAASTESGIPTVSILDRSDRIQQAFEDADVAQAAVCSAPALTLAGLELVERFGRRNVLRLPSTKVSADIDRLLPTQFSARLFGPGITYEHIERRVAAGATIGVVNGATRGHGDDGGDVLLLAAVRSDGTVNLQPGARTPVGDEILIGLRGRPQSPT
jgi:NhaP-type Na+/H+ or K+/H+ antiporter